MQYNIKTCKEYTKNEKSSNFLELLKEIKYIAYKFEMKGYIYSSLHDYNTAFFKVFQLKNVTESEYLTRFRAIVAVIQYYKGNIGYDTIIVHTDMIKTVLK